MGSPRCRGRKGSTRLRFLLGATLAGALAAGCAGRSYSLHYTEGHRTDADDVARMVNGGNRQVERYFGRPYPRAFDLRVFPDRASLTAYWRQAWGAPEFEPQCWMVASGTASTLAILSPAAWKKEACEHDPDDRPATQRLVTHELVHVYHGQVNPNPEFDGVEEIGWFVEGLAVLVSGQLDDGRLARARAAVASGKAPARLQDAWSGPDRYGIAGSLVSYVDRTWGRATLLSLMRCTSNGEILEILGTSEEELLSRWKADLADGGPSAPGG